jgi:glycosyltransferase involved in cell wall biosynthesis
MAITAPVDLPTTSQMSFAIYTTELTAANAHLMPWRTIFEVAACWQIRGLNALIISGGDGNSDLLINGVRVLQVGRPRGLEASRRLGDRLSQQGVQRLFFPIASGSLYARFAEIVRSQGIDLVWYYPGAWYTFDQIVRAARVMSLRAILPYAYQAIVPKRIWIQRLKALENFPVIAMTSHTAQQLKRYGYSADRVFAIPPGKAPVAQRGEVSPACIQIEQAVGNTRLFLFFGPPNPIRGVNHILEAFARVSHSHPDVRLVCLFRGDNNVDSTLIRKRIARMGLGERLITHWESVGPADLDRLLKSCYAVLKPFVIVPSEIPLAVIETAEYGKPVIGFQGDGTGEFIGRFGLLAKHGDSRDLAEAMKRLLDDPNLYRERCRAALAVYETHPTWDQVAEQWLNVGGKTVAGNSKQLNSKGTA